MPLAHGKPVNVGVESLSAWSARKLFPDAFSPEAAISGLYLYFCAYDESHTISQEVETPEGSFWHGIMHRQEPDPGNAAYWFRRVGQHPIFPQLRDAAAELGLRVKDSGTRSRLSISARTLEASPVLRRNKQLWRFNW